MEDLKRIIIFCGQYYLTLLAVLYAIGAILMVFTDKRKKIKGFYYYQNVLAFLFHLTGWILIVLNQSEEEYIRTIVFYVLQLVYFIVYLSLYRKLHRNEYLILQSNMVMLMSIGLIMLYRLNPDKAIRQFIFFVVISIATLWVPVFTRKLKAARAWAGTCGVIGLILLIAVLLVGRVTDESTYGANLSLTFGGFSVQPSELVKITYVLMIAVLFRKRSDFKRVVFTAGIAAVHVIVLVLSKDLGSALIFFLAFMAMLYVATKQPWYMAAGFSAGAVAAVIATKLFTHVQTRVDAWLNPWDDITGGGWQTAQSLFSIGTGGWWGSGLYKGLPNLVPVVTKDYIFSAIAEEMGTIVAICLIVICASCFILFMKIASNIFVRYYKLMGTGLACLYGVQVFLTIGGGIKLIPATGVTLPLVSYGGSSVLSTFVLFGIMQGLYIMERNEEERNGQQG
ncbi:MAG: FtsW/RodA/SpoVE family cell cycle protein [Lachnospiraceae bacterium]